MEACSTTASLKCPCPRCGKVLEAANLQALTKKVRVCCTKSKVRQRRKQIIVTTSTPFVVDINKPIISQNKSTYAHWTFYNKDKNDWRAAIEMSPLRALFGARFPHSKWHVSRNYTPPQREFDFGNLVGGCKPVWDALTYFDIIEDDKPSCFSAEYEQAKGTGYITRLSLLSYDYNTTDTIRKL